MKLCPTCSGSPGKRMWLAVGMPHEDKPINVVMCEDPLHDAADRVGEIVEENIDLRETLRIALLGFEAIEGATADPMVQTCAMVNRKSIEAMKVKALPEVPR